MIRRIWFALSMARRHCKALKSYVQDPSLQVASVSMIDPITLKAQGILGLVVDFDGVLASHGEDRPNKEFDSWLNLCIQTFGRGRVFILSNKPTEERKAYFNQYFSGIIFLITPQKKPYPGGILQIANTTQVKPEALMIVDDRLFTGILAAILARAKARYVTKPQVQYSKRPFRECFFMGLRIVERWMVFCCF